MAVLLLLTGLALCVWLVVAYNRLVRHANLAKEAWSGIDVQLRRRHDLVPNLVEVVKSYASYESDVLSEVTRLRSEAQRDANLGPRQDHENALTGRLKSLLALVEAYPELKANRNFLELQEQLIEVEDHLQMARRYYNGAVRDYNTSVESIPSNLVAALFGFAPREFFQVESATVRSTPEVQL